MSLQVKGKMVVMYDTVQVSEKFRKREFVIEIAEEVNGQVYTNFAKFQAVQNRCDALNNISAGQTVTVDFNLKGNSYTDKKDGVTKYITNLDAWRVSVDDTRPTPVAQEVERGSGAQDAASNPNDLPF